MFNGGAPGLGGAPVTKALLLAVGGASLVLRIRGGEESFGGESHGPGFLSRSLGFSTAGELIFAAALLYQSRATERAVGPAAAASGAALGGVGGAALAAVARALLSALFSSSSSGGGGGGGSGSKGGGGLLLGPYPLVFALLVPLVLDVPATTSIVLAAPSSSSSSSSSSSNPPPPASSSSSSSSAAAATTPSSSSSSRGIKITDKAFLYAAAAQLLACGGLRRSLLPALAGVAAGVAVRRDVAGLGSLRFPALASGVAARALGPLLGWSPIKECVVLPSAAAAAARRRQQQEAAALGGRYGLGVAGRAPPPPPPPPPGQPPSSWAAAAAEPPAAAVAQLVAMGFAEGDARDALRRRAGDVSAALSDLLG